MGWWEERIDGKRLTLGDEPIDRLAQVLEDFVGCYQEEVGRKPTSDEFLISLRNILQAAGPDFFSDLEARAVTGVALRTKKAPKRQKFQVGDYFAVPLPDGRYFYGRILHYTHLGHLIEVYTLDTRVKLSFRQLLKRKRKVAFYKHVFVEYAFNEGRWAILGHEPIPKSFKYPRFYLGNGGQIARGDKIVETPMSVERTIRTYEAAVAFDPDTIEERLVQGMFDGWPEIEEARREDLDFWKPSPAEHRKSSAPKRKKSRKPKRTK
jgi:hypothetical protein